GGFERLGHGGLPRARGRMSASSASGRSRPLAPQTRRSRRGRPHSRLALERLGGFVLRLADSVLSRPDRLLGGALGLQAGVAGNLAGGFLDGAGGLLGGAFDAIGAHGLSLSWR